MEPLPIGHIHPPVSVIENHYLLQTSTLVGEDHYQFHKISHQLEIGQILALVPEPANPHDEYAVRVQAGDHHLGYLPRTSNHVVSRLLRQNCPLIAQIAYLSPESSPPLTLHVLLATLSTKFILRS